MSAGAPMDPHGEMRARDISRVARGEQAPRPPHEYGTVSKAPPPASVKLPSNNNRNNMPRADKEDEKMPADQPRHCYASYVGYHRCVRDKGKDACNKLASHYKALCPNEWVEKWDEQRDNGTFPPI